MKNWRRWIPGPRWLVIAPPYVWMLLFFAIPFAIAVKISFAHQLVAMPPYTDLWAWDGKDLDVRLNINNYLFLVEDSLYYAAYLSSLKIALISTFFCLLIGYPIAYAIARMPPASRNFFLMLVILPSWTSFLIRIYAWIGILKKEGLLNLFLMNWGIINEPLSILNTTTAVYIGIVYSYLPFMILPLYASLEKISPALLEAAEDLGSRPWKAFWQVTFPLSLPGVYAGCLLVFIPAVGEFVIPDLLGGSQTLMIGKTLWSEFFNNRDWPLASAVAVVLLLVLVIPIVLFQRQQQMEREAGR